ncbi:MAG: PglZ domain-containing protein [Methanothrix sp.]|nr:PglZ domain-containing protein [Methanothrix sp.]
MLKDWVLSKLEDVKDSPRVLVSDPLQLLRPDSVINEFATSNGFTAIPASTNLVFRELYDAASSDPETPKILLIDRTPESRKARSAINKAPPLFYPDFLAKTPQEARIRLDLREFLKEKTGDPNWPAEANESRYARLIVKNIEGTLRAHSNLRTADERRFTDHDFKTIVAFATLGVPEKAFKKLDSRDLWTIGLLKHEELRVLEYLAADIIKPIKDQFSQAEPPFCWFGDHDPERVIRAFYLSAILAQHFDNWQLMLANIDPLLKPLSNIKLEVLKEAAPKLVELDFLQAESDLGDLEDSLTQESLKLLLIDQMKIMDAKNFASVIEKEEYSTFLRSLALLAALEDLLTSEASPTEHRKINEVIFGGHKGARFVDLRESSSWSNLKTAYHLAYEIRRLRSSLFEALRKMRVTKDDFAFEFFRDLWNKKEINRLEYNLSRLARLAEGQKLLPCSSDRLPKVFLESLDHIKQRIQEVTEKTNDLLDEINLRFQETVKKQYPSWIEKDGDVILTSQILRRCIKPHWDPKKEKAVLFIFDGMRYDIWDELFRPMLMGRMDLIKDYPASSLLPSETHITRKAISAGANPDEFDSRRGEDDLLREALAREFRYAGQVEVVNPDGAGTGETVHYRAGNLDVYIFELCDKELHKIKMKEISDGRLIPSRPIAFIYTQLIKDILKNEVMEIVRGLSPGTKVFITADHGFVQVGREPIWFNEEDLNDEYDCSYLNCRLKQSLLFSRIPDRIKENMISFTPSQLRMPSKEVIISDRRTNTKITKTYQSIVFPKIRYYFSRKGGHKPDAFTHGGISIQEMMIPMCVLQVKQPDAGELKIELRGSKEAVEGEEVELDIILSRPDDRESAQDLRVDIEASYNCGQDEMALPLKVAYLSALSEKVVFYRFVPDMTKLPPSERLKEDIKVIITVTVNYKEGRRATRRSLSHEFRIRINSEKIIRRMGNLGSILGLTPRGMR